MASGGPAAVSSRGRESAVSVKFYLLAPYSYNLFFAPSPVNLPIEDTRH